MRLRANKNKKYVTKMYGKAFTIIALSVNIWCINILRTFTAYLI